MDLGKKEDVTRRHEVRMTRYDAALCAVEKTIQKSTSCAILFGVNKHNITPSMKFLFPNVTCV